LTGANEVGNVVGKRLTGRELFWANAACRARRHCDQREHHANRRQTNHHSLRPACVTRPQVNLTDSVRHSSLMVEFMLSSQDVPILCRAIQLSFANRRIVNSGQLLPPAYLDLYRIVQ
jgi:hypothetical protein